MRYLPDGRTFASSGVVRESSSKRVSGSVIPARPAIATRGMIAFVLPPIAMSAPTALSNASRVRISDRFGPPAVPRGRGTRVVERLAGEDLGRLGPAGLGHLPRATPRELRERVPSRIR